MNMGNEHSHGLLNAPNGVATTGPCLAGFPVIIRFFVLAVLYNIVLLFPWATVRNGYQVLFINAGKTLFTNFGSQGLVEIEKRLPHHQGDNDCLVLLGRRAILTGGEVPIHTGRVGYVPNAVLTALVLATPVPWSRRLIALFLGLVAINSFIVLRMVLLLLYWFSRPVPFRLFEPAPFWNSVLSGAYEYFFVAPTCSFLIPMLIWMLVAFRTQDFAPARPACVRQ